MAIKKLTFLICSIVSVFIFQAQSIGQTQTFSTGSAIIDMGSASPTVQNSLKPYGLVYALLKNKHVPVSYVVNAAKVKDGIDFVYSGKNYKGGTFIVSSDYISSDVTTLLNSWANQGVIIDYTTSDLTVNVTYKINFVPKWAMDRTNGSIAVSFLNAAGIPASAYNFKNPSQLDGCDDIFVLPHADPTWDSHSKLYFWNKNNKGSIWAGCHAVSVLENISTGVTGDGTPTNAKMNFLSTNGLLSFFDHNITATPFSNLLPGDPVAQYINKTDNAQLNGSETVYLPKPGSAWNTGAKIITSSPGQVDVPSLSPGIAVENIYGRAYDESTRGYVAYQAAHNIGGTGSDQIAAQRIFFNFSLFALHDKVPPIIDASLSGQLLLTAGVASAPFTATVTGTGTGFTYQWRASVAGTFSAATSASTTFTPSNSITSSTPCIITCVVTESCGRISFDSKKVTVIPPSPTLDLPVVDIIKSIADGCASAAITFNVFTNNADPNAGTRTLLSVTGLGNGTVLTSTNGDITFTPLADFKGVTTGKYQITNGLITSNVNNGAISITVGIAALSPVLTDDGVTALVDNVTVINVLGNDKNNTAASANVHDSLYIRDIPTKPTKGYVYINANGTLSYVSNSTKPTGTDNFQYLACKTTGYCAVGTVSVTLVTNSCAAGQYKNTSDSTIGSLTATDPSIDAYIQTGGSANTNFNGTTFLINGFSNSQRRPVIKFDLSSIPITARITSANISLTFASTFSPTVGVNPFPATIYAVTQLWIETEVTWNSYATATLWTTAGGDFTVAGSDPTFPNTFTDGVIYPAGTVIASNAITSLVQSWVITPSGNLGMIFFPNSSPTTLFPSFHSRSGATSADRPKINIFYKTPPSCLTIPTTYLPIIYPDATTTSSTASVTISPLSNDVNYYGNTNSLVSFTTPANGTASISGNQIIYAPNGSFVGIDADIYC